MSARTDSLSRRRFATSIAVAISVALAGCGSGSKSATSAATTTGTTTSVATTTGATTSDTPTDTTGTSTTTPVLPGTGRPQILLGDKNFTEQFVLGQLYLQALSAEGFNVNLTRNIGPTEVTAEAMRAGTLDLYPEYLNVFNRSIAHDSRAYMSVTRAYAAASRYATDHGMQLLNPTPFSDTQGLVVTDTYAQTSGLRSLGDLRRVAAEMTLGAPPEFQEDPAGLPAIEQAYGFYPLTLESLDIGAQYASVRTGSVQAAYAASTDPQLVFPGYRLLSDPKHVLGIGNVVPVVSAKTIQDEGPAFVATLNDVDALLTTQVIRQLNAAVDLAHEDPASVARKFLQLHGLVPLPTP